MSDLGLGQIIRTEQQRDAIHVAVAPVEAAEDLQMGWHVGLDADGKATTKVAKAIGIVDPFLRGPVPKGERFWLFLYPGTITSLRHDWTHPAFAAKEKIDVSESIKWITDWANTLNLSYEEAMQAADDYELRSEYLCEGGLYEGCSVPDAFWDHYQVIRGKVVESRGSFFSCYC